MTLRIFEVLCRRGKVTGGFDWLCLAENKTLLMQIKAEEEAGLHCLKCNLIFWLK
jgi:hypothetical protein